MVFSYSNPNRLRQSLSAKNSPLENIEKSTVYNTTHNNKIFSNKSIKKCLRLTQRKI